MLPLIALPVSTGDLADNIQKTKTITLLSTLQSELEHGQKGKMFAILYELEERSAKDKRVRNYVASELKKMGVHCKGSGWFDNRFHNCEYSPKLDKNEPKWFF